MFTDAIGQIAIWLRQERRSKGLFVFAVILSAGAVAVSAQQSGDRLWQIISGERVGQITVSTSEEQIIVIFGAGNVRRSDVDIGEGEMRPGTVVYPDDPTKRIEITWKEEAQFRSPSEVWIRGRSSKWRTDKGLSLGSTLKQIEKLNGRPFVLTGFGWDYSGTIIDCNQGRLKEIGCIDPKDPTLKVQGRKIVLRLMPDEETLTTREYEAVLGDRYFSSGHPAMQKLNPRVYEMIVIFEP